MIRSIYMILALIMPLLNLTTTSASLADYQVIPDEAIRLRILAESDAEEDQIVKRAVRDAVNDQITEWVITIDNIEEARALIQEKLPEIEHVVKDTLAQFDPLLDFQVAYDRSVQFPTKLYDTYLYPAGEYEAILITLGEGKGSNWWCVLFPPLCFLDFSAGTTVGDHEAEQHETEEESEQESTKVSFFFLKWFR